MTLMTLKLIAKYREGGEMPKGCGCPKCQSMPDVVDGMIERLDTARLLGAVPFLLVIRAEDLGEIEAWYGDPVTAFQGVPIRALEGQESMITPIMVLSLSESKPEYEQKLAEAGIEMEVVGLARGDCWCFAEEGKDVPRSD